MAYAPITLAPHEAAVLAVFNPNEPWSLDSLHACIDKAVDFSPASNVDPRFKAIIAEIQPHKAPETPWFKAPQICDAVLILRIRKFKEGNAAPEVRKLSIEKGLAVLDLATDLVFASPNVQSVFTGSEWTSLTKPLGEGGWAMIGSFISHTTFGAGRILDIGEYKGMRVFVVQFSDRERILSVQLGLPHMRPSQTT